VGQHACQLDDAAELHLAPASADGGGAQCPHQIGGFAVQLLLGGGERAHLLVERRIGTQAVGLDRSDLVADPLSDRGWA
jgi:hypothetical protein